MHIRTIFVCSTCTLYTGPSTYATPSEQNLCFTCSSSFCGTCGYSLSSQPSLCSECLIPLTLFLPSPCSPHPIVPSFIPRPFTSNVAAQFLYFFKCAYFVVSSVQIKDRYPDHNIRWFLDINYAKDKQRFATVKSTIFSVYATCTYMCMYGCKYITEPCVHKLIIKQFSNLIICQCVTSSSLLPPPSCRYRWIPLLPEVKEMTDWVFTDSGLNLTQWLTVEEIWSSLYPARLAQGQVTNHILHCSTYFFKQLYLS